MVVDHLDCRFQGRDHPDQGPESAQVRQVNWLLRVLAHKFQIPAWERNSHQMLRRVQQQEIGQKGPRIGNLWYQFHTLQRS
jgi:hypothetical protein